MPADQDRDFQDAVTTVKRTLEHVRLSDPKERDSMVEEWTALTDMARKLETGRVDIALFGEVSSGKSALINALVGEYVADVNVRGGWTKEDRPRRMASPRRKGLAQANSSSSTRRNQRS